MIFVSTITIFIYFKRLYNHLSKRITFVVLGPVISEKSSNENGHILKNGNVGKSKRVFKAFSFNDFSVITDDFHLFKKNILGTL